MRPRTSTLAKLVRPRSHEPVIRERLHTLLKETAERKVTWVSAPPGGGKTTLISSWVHSHPTPGPWYQFDAGDADAATFFYYLRIAFRMQAPRAKAPPLLTPEYALDVSAFSRRFFRVFFHHLPLNSICVFDNYHELPVDSPVHEAFAAAVNEIPPGMRVVVCSRSDPPGAFAQAIARDQLVYIGWDALRLSAEESCAIALTRGASNPDIARQLHDLCNGWAAGLTLMTERLRRGADVGTIDRSEMQEGVFDYFADQILRSTDNDTKAVLLSSAFLPRVNTLLARKLSGIESAGRVLDSLYRRQLFVEQRGSEEYQFHPLFQRFLRSEATRALNSTDRLALMRRSADLLAESQYWVAAFELYTEANDWKTAVTLLKERAPILLSQGRQQTLQAWIQRLPASIRDADPWIDYWVGRSLLASDPHEARAQFEKSYAKATTDQWGKLRLFSSAAVLEARYYEFSDFRAMDPWIARVAEYISDGAVHFLEPCDELLMVSTFIMAASYRAPDHPLLVKCVERAAELVVLPLEDNLRVGAVSMLFAYAVMSLDQEAEAVARREATRLLGNQEVSALRAAFCLASEGYLHYTVGRYEMALKCFDRCDSIAEAEGLTEHTSMSRLWRGLTQRRAGLLNDAERTIARILAEPSQPSGQRAAVFALLRAVVANDRSEYQLALSYALVAQDIAERAGQFNGGSLLIIVVANIAIGAGEYELAERSLRRMRERVNGPMTSNYLAPIALNESWLAHRRGKHALRDELLSECLQRSHDYGARIRLQWYPNALSELLPVALATQIEAECARRLIRQFGIRPKPADQQDWPWRVRVSLLGACRVEVDGNPIAFGRKVPRKTLLLLAAIAATGGASVPEQIVMDALWPQSDGDAAYRALTTSLRRLRALLGVEQFIHLKGGRIYLDRDICWCDVWALENLAENDRDGETAMSLYTGPFLPAEEEAWVIGPRERIRAKFADAVIGSGLRLERQGQLKEALRIYSRAAEADPHVESFYVGQMRCYVNLKRAAEALGVFRRLTQMLAQTFGRAPSAASCQLYDEIVSV